MKKLVFLVAMIAAAIHAFAWDYEIDFATWANGNYTTPPYEVGSTISVVNATNPIWNLPTYYDYSGINPIGTTSIPVKGPGTYAVGGGGKNYGITVPPAAPTTYLVTVNGGTGGGNFAQGATVNIVAGTPPAGQQFKNWTVVSGGVSLANANSSSTSFTMPANAVTVTANYELETAVEVVEASKTVVYPSGKGQVTVNSTSSIEGVWIYTLTGQLEKAVTVRGNEVVINDLPRGQVLVMRVAVNGSIKTFKVVLK